MSCSSPQSTFLSCDWGTSTFRLRRVEVQPFRLGAEVRLDEGASAVRARILAAGLDSAAEFRAVLERALKEMPAAFEGLEAAEPILISGMASSSIGWKELSYANVPFSLSGNQARWEGLGYVESAQAKHRVFLISGLKTDRDVLGILSDPAYAAFRKECLLILPGTHSKHIVLKNEHIVAFTTYMTGELYQVLSEHSILRHSVAGGGQGQDWEAFQQGALFARAKALSGALFSVRTNQLLLGLDPARNASYLSGLLVGTEISDMVGRAPPSMPLLLCAGRRLRPSYELTFQAFGLLPRLTIVSEEDVEAASACGHAFFLGSQLKKALTP